MEIEFIKISQHFKASLDVLTIKVRSVWGKKCFSIAGNLVEAQRIKITND